MIDMLNMYKVFSVYLTCSVLLCMKGSCSGKPKVNPKVNNYLNNNSKIQIFQVESNEDISNVAKDSNFTYFTFTQAWPTTVCLQGEDEGHKCTAVLNVTGWTIHGLWPSGGKSKEGPEDCNKTAKFDPEAIESLMNDLRMYWPNLYVDTPSNDFWEHEWSKHGTCASSVNQTSNEFLYFKEGLDLYKSINLSQIMMDLNFVPTNDKQYDVNDMLDGLKTKFDGVEPILSCYKSKKDHQFYLDEVEICYDKQFRMIDCLKQRSTKYLFFKSLKNILLKDIMTDDHILNCPKGGKVYYPTIHGSPNI